LNDRLNGVEIHFSRRPDDATLAPLRADPAWRYSGHSKCWYARQLPQTNAFAQAFCEKFNGGQRVLPTPLETKAAEPGANRDQIETKPAQDEPKRMPWRIIRYEPAANPAS
jgi:hypothetical protein